jgi:L-ascorbate metabolism protein UlaG (beta-lactamase superfamily)
MITFENGLTVYFAGSTAITMDQQLWGSLYKPDIAILPLASRRDPMDLAHMVRLLRTENPNLKTVIPHHHRVKTPPGAASPEAFEEALNALKLPVTFLNPELGKSYSFTK